jgi:hypothetical protein
MGRPPAHLTPSLLRQRVELVAERLRHTDQRDETVAGFTTVLPPTDGAIK